MVVMVSDAQERARIARRVLCALPDWFGVPESLNAYAEDSKALPLWAHYEGGEADGFLVMKETSPCAAELHVMGVMPGRHRQGVGKALVQAFLAEARARGYLFAHVKTVKPGCYPQYDKTNEFYRAMGFHALECIPEIWDEANPCQLLIMAIDSAQKLIGTIRPARGTPARRARFHARPR